MFLTETESKVQDELRRLVDQIDATEAAFTAAGFTGFAFAIQFTEARERVSNLIYEINCVEAV